LVILPALVQNHVILVKVIAIEIVIASMVLSVVKEIASKGYLVLLASVKKVKVKILLVMVIIVMIQSTLLKQKLSGMLKLDLDLIQNLFK
jgi:hypothetical protein